MRIDDFKISHTALLLRVLDPAVMMYQTRQRQGKHPGKIKIGEKKIGWLYRDNTDGGRMGEGRKYFDLYRH